MTLRTPDDISVSYNGFSEFSKNRASVSYPPKMDIPFVWDLYMDTERPLGAEQAAPPAASPVTGAGDDGLYGASAARDSELLTLMNDRMKQQTRRYPHPITNQMEDFQ